MKKPHFFKKNGTWVLIVPEGGAILAPTITQAYSIYAETKPQ
jgi:hypothetical protein